MKPNKANGKFDLAKHRENRIAELIDNLFEPDSNVKIPTAELAAQAEIIQLADSFELDIHTIYCHKTGRPIGKRTDGEIELLLEIHGVNKAKSLWPFINLSAISPAWLETTPTVLERLMQIDPHGYFVYISAIAFSKTAVGWQQGKCRFKSVQYEAKYNIQKAALYKKLISADINLVKECAEAFLNFMKIMSNKDRATQTLITSGIKNLIQLADEDVLIDLPITLRNATVRELIAHGYGSDWAQNIITIDKLKSKASSVFLHQRKPKGMTELEEITALISDLNIGTDITSNDVSEGTYHAYIAETRGIKTPKKSGASVKGNLSDVLGKLDEDKALRLMVNADKPKKTLKEMLAERRGK